MIAENAGTTNPTAREYFAAFISCRFEKVIRKSPYIRQEPVENYDYEHQPHEIEARENEQILYDLWMMDKQPVSFFPNRLTA